jgi:membrane-associated phospholipid phosphatase
MSSHRLRDSYVMILMYLIITILIGVLVVLLPLNGIECNIVMDLQSFARRTGSLQVFLVLTYLGDFYLWVISASVFILYARFRSRENLDSAIELAVFLVITTALTYFMKLIFARPRPDCPSISIIGEDVVSSFSYPSGHVSRATGAFLILARKNRTRESLAILAIFLVSLSRIVLGAHYLTDVVGAVFLSLAAQKLAGSIMPLFKSKMGARMEKTC